MIRDLGVSIRLGFATTVLLVAQGTAAAATPDSTRLVGAWWWAETRGVDGGSRVRVTPAMTGRDWLLLIGRDWSYRFFERDSARGSFRCEGAVVVQSASGIKSGSGMSSDFWIHFKDWCEPWIRDQLVSLAGPDTLVSYPGSRALTVADAPTLVFARIRPSLAESLIAGKGWRFPGGHEVMPALRDSWPRGQEGEFVYYEEPPIPLHRVEPAYAQWLKDAHIECEVVLHVLVDKNGRVRMIKVIRGVTGVNEAAVDAVKQWVFKPALARGEPVATWTELKFRFPPP